MDWDKVKKLNVRIEIPEKIKKLLALLIGTFALTWVIANQLDYLSLNAYRVVKLIAPIIVALPSIVFFLRNKRNYKELFSKDNLFLQILWGILIGALFLIISAIKNDGLHFTNEAGVFVRYDWYKIYITVYYLLLVGFLEEFTYRVVVQDYFSDIIQRNKALAPLFAALAFSMAHLALGGTSILIVSFAWGLMLGYLKYICKSFTYLSAALAHGIYDYGLLIIPVIIEAFK